MNILIIVQAYPDLHSDKSMMFVHTRNKFYTTKGITPTVLSFSAKKDYSYEGIRVITEKTFKQELDQSYSILVSHSPNLKKHLFFLTKNEYRFQNIVFFFHGHEVLKTREIYPKPYKFQNHGLKAKTSCFIRPVYDFIKLRIWRTYFESLAPKAQFIFVSNYLYSLFNKYVGLDEIRLLGHTHIINNCVGKIFEEKSYRPSQKLKYDFVTIRLNLDNSTYCIDLVNCAAKKYPAYRFLLIGSGRYFRFDKKAPNIDWIDHAVNHKEMIEYLNMSRCALMPTRHDTQGVMSCELATYGIPLITSDIPVCREVFKEMLNVAFIANSTFMQELPEVYNITKRGSLPEKNDKYSSQNTVAREVELFYSLQ